MLGNPVGHIHTDGVHMRDKLNVNYETPGKPSSFLYSASSLSLTLCFSRIARTCHGIETHL